MDGYIAKPVKKLELVDLVRAHTSHLSHESGAVGEGDETPALADDLLARFDGDAQLLHRLSKIFIEQTPPMMETLRRAVTTHNAIVLKQTAHKLIGSLGAFGADAAVNCARELEHLAGDNAFAPAEKVFTKLGDEVDALQSRLASVT